ncbi:hypothetical protein OKW38_002964 [Paraburkholderia sp. MM5496-R1]|uniref:hypothetical protein n=1 Tax=unclassified Paraburkholderia TaxID=2615204 RepID=UPI003D2211D6
MRANSSIHSEVLAELEQATNVLNALDSLIGVQFSGGGLEPEEFYTVTAELSESITRRLDTAHRAIAGNDTAPAISQEAAHA